MYEFPIEDKYLNLVLISNLLKNRYKNHKPLSHDPQTVYDVSLSGHKASFKSGPAVFANI